jgi:1-acyl-sn-glycerol-3-phosphate acyltransferase
MSVNSPLETSRLLLALLSTRVFAYYEDRIPPLPASLLVVSNHRSFMDAPVLMSALSNSIRFACHHYMGQVPIMREIVTGQLGCFPLEVNEQGASSFFHESQKLLVSKQAVGVFPEGTQPMVKLTQPNVVGQFQRGFAHLALRADVTDLAILPIAIASLEEVNTSAVPLKLLSLFDPSEPLFNSQGWHPLVTYNRVAVLIGHPYWITKQHQKKYQGKNGKSLVAQVTEHCHSEIASLLSLGCY